MRIFNKIFGGLFDNNSKSKGIFNKKEKESVPQIPKVGRTTPKTTKNSANKSVSANSNNNEKKQNINPGLLIERMKVHHYNQLWKISKNIPDSPFKEYWEDMKSITQIEIIQKYNELIELEQDSIDKNIIGIKIKGNDLNAAHIPLNKIPKEYRRKIKWIF